MKKGILLSLAAASLLVAQEVQLGTVSVEEKLNIIEVQDVSGEALKSADLAEALNRQVPSITINRRSGIANDIILRGQKRDNINVLIDGAFIHGACSNRMDPPTSHVLTNSIENVEVQEGPFDVEYFGGLSGTVKVNTLKPTKEMHGEINLNAGSWGSKKASAVVSGGTDKARLLISASTEEGGQYEDGDGKTLATQLSEKTTDTTKAYLTQYKDIDAYEKKSVMTKGFFTIADNQELRLSYTANRSDNILYASTPMDAMYDDSNLFTAEYRIDNMTNYSDRLSLHFFKSDVDHPMSTKYRVSATSDGSKEMIHHLKTDGTGFKIKNQYANLTYGVDMSKREWDGSYYKLVDTFMNKSLDNTETKNRALFATMEEKLDGITLNLGARYDDTRITTNSTQQNRDFHALNAHLFATFHANKNSDIFVGVGRSSRVPDPRELYLYDKKLTAAPAVEVGTPTLKQTKNSELDLGIEKRFEEGVIKGKIFYSKLDDYIVFNGGTANKFANVDATITGIELSGLYLFSDSVSIDYGLAYQRGKEDTPSGDNDNLPDIPPLKLTLATTIDFTEQNSATLELIAADAWDSYDSDRGEQKISGYGIVNAKYQHELPKGFALTLGVDNLFDKTYAISNTYNDLTLISTGTDKMLLNEPGRYYYANLSYSF
jgi:iron complex outermembrane receptor protein